MKRFFIPAALLLSVLFASCSWDVKKRPAVSFGECTDIVNGSGTLSFRLDPAPEIETLLFMSLEAPAGVSIDYPERVEVPAFTRDATLSVTVTGVVNPGTYPLKMTIDEVWGGLLYREAVGS